MKKTRSVEVAYKGDGLSDLDGDLRSLASAHRGSFTGSGYCFPAAMRDLSFRFPHSKNAGAFRRAVKTKHGNKVEVS